MKEVELQLIPAPGQKPEFLAKVELVHKQNIPELWQQLPSVVVLEGYTRDSWASDTATKWTTWQVESVDGRNKLPGFVKYLRDRQKTCFGRVGDRVWVISHKQMSSSTLNCRITSISSIPKCPLKPQQAPSKPVAPQPAKQEAAKPTTMPTTTPAAAANSKPKKKGFGLLGNLVGAQKRTNTQMEIAATAIPKKSSVAPNQEGAATTEAGEGGSGDSSQASTAGTKTAGQVLADFRQEMEQEMLDFDISSEPCLKVKIDVAAKLRTMSDEEKQTGKVSMEILKYIVYEQAEEVNEEWIAYREPSEFMDEATIAIYKEGEAPAEVLEDINKAELPDEVRGQQRAIQEQRQKAEQIRAQKLRMEQTKLAMQLKKKNEQQGGEEDDDDFAALNTQKRDRRTIEDYEREAKRRRGDE